MSGGPQSAWKLGLFVVLGFLSLLGAGYWLVAQRLDPEVLTAVTYFNESVEGLDVGSPIKIRGVKVGVVSAITIAPDHRMVEVRMRLFLTTLERLGLWPPPGDRPGAERLGPDDLRLQLASSGITGLKFIQADFFEPADYPELAIEFPPGANYVPSVPSTLKSLGDALATLAEQLPRAVEDVERLLQTLQEKLEQARVEELATRLEGLLASLDEQVAAIDGEALSREIQAFAGESREAARAIEALATRLTSEGGDLDRLGGGVERWSSRIEAELADARLQETVGLLRDALARVGTAADSLRSLGDEAGTSVGPLREALLALRALVQLLERDPAALLRGRSPGVPHPLEEGR